LVASKHKPQQVVEAGEMVHVAVGDEDIADPQELAGRQRRQIAEVKEERPPIEHQLYEEAGVPEGIVHEMGIESRGHRDYRCIAVDHRPSLSVHR